MICVIFCVNCINMDNELGFLEGCMFIIKNIFIVKKVKKKKEEK